MSFLRPNRSRLLPLSTVLIGLGLGISPIRAADQVAQPVVVEADDVDVAKVQSGGQIVLISSGQRLTDSHAIDDDRRTTFQFSKSDPRPTVIVKLNDMKPVHRVSVIPGSESQKVDVYLLNELPRDVAALDKIQPLASIVDLAVGREAAVEFAPQKALYVALRWTLAAHASGPLRIAEISAFSKADAPQVTAALAATDPPISLVTGPPIIAPVSE
jgi:hypothetical protein